MKRQNLKPAVIIFSVDIPSRTPCQQLDWRNWARRTMDVQEIEYKEVSGQYEGVRELSFVVPAHNQDMIKIITRSAGQAGYLFIHEDRGVDFRETNGTRTYMGQFINVGSTKPRGDFTYDNGNYYEVI